MALTVRTDSVLEEALASLSKLEGISRQEIIRRAVLERYERSDHVIRTNDSTQRMVARWETFWSGLALSDRNRVSRPRGRRGDGANSNGRPNP